MIVSFQVTNDSFSGAPQNNQQEKSALALRKEAKSKLLQWVKEKTNIDVKDCDVRFVLFLFSFYFFRNFKLIFCLIFETIKNIKEI